MSFISTLKEITFCSGNKHANLHFIIIININEVIHNESGYSIQFITS